MTVTEKLAAERTFLKCEVTCLRAALERLGSMACFETPRMIDPDKDAELLARIVYATDRLEDLRKRMPEVAG